MVFARTAKRKNETFTTLGFLSLNMLHYSFLEIKQVFKWNKDFIISFIKSDIFYYLSLLYIHNEENISKVNNVKIFILESNSSKSLSTQRLSYLFLPSRVGGM